MLLSVKNRMDSLFWVDRISCGLSDPQNFPKEFQLSIAEFPSYPSKQSQQDWISKALNFNCVGNIPTKYGMSDARRDGVMTIRIKKFEKYPEIPIIYSSSGCNLLVDVSWYGWSSCVSSLKSPRLKGVELWRKIFEGA